MCVDYVYEKWLVEDLGRMSNSIETAKWTESLPIDSNFRHFWMTPRFWYLFICTCSFERFLGFKLVSIVFLKQYKNSKLLQGFLMSFVQKSKTKEIYFLWISLNLLHSLTIIIILQYTITPHTHTTLNTNCKKKQCKKILHHYTRQNK